MTLRPPISVVLARPVRQMPVGGRFSIEPKFDGWRLVVFRHEDGVQLQARSGRLITDVLPDLASAAMQLPPGTVLDGECVVYSGGRIDFHAMQRRALAAVRRAEALSRSAPVSYVAFDCLEFDGEDIRGRPYLERRLALLRVLEGIGPPIQATPATTSVEQIQIWWDTLPDLGIEGLVAKHIDRAYVGGMRDWQKLKHGRPRERG